MSNCNVVCKSKKRITAGMKVILLTGDAEYRNKTFIVDVIDGEYVTLKGFKKLKKFIKPNPDAGNENFKLIDKKVHIANVALFDEKLKKPSKIGFKIIDGVKQRISKKSGEILQNLAIKTKNKK